MHLCVTLCHWQDAQTLLNYFTVKQCHADYALCGSDILQAFVFNGTDDNLNFARRKDGRPLLKVMHNKKCLLYVSITLLLVAIENH